MNNTFYGDLIEDAVYMAGQANTVSGKSAGFMPADEENTLAFASAQINYLSETRLGDEIVIRCHKRGNQYRIAGTAEGRAVFAALLTEAAPQTLQPPPQRL
jgi:hypothetical protein